MAVFDRFTTILMTESLEKSYGIFYNFQPKVAFCRDTPSQKKPRSPGFWDLRDFPLGIFPGFFRNFQIQIPISGISGFSGLGSRDFFGIF